MIYCWKPNPSVLRRPLEPAPQKKNGRRNGKQRWRCTNCDASTTHNRPDVTARNQLASFITWLMGKLTQAEHAGGTRRTFRHQTKWCRNVRPYLNRTGEVFDEIQDDGIYLRKGRCLVHIQRNVRTYLTLNPRLAAGRSLRQLSLQLTRIRTQEAAAAWMSAFASWHTENQDLLNERTYATHWAGPLPKRQRKSRPWWYTHERLRKAYESMNRALRRGHLFTHLDQDLEGLGISATTNMIEGAINSGIREMIRNHRGMPIEHRRRACEWFCWTHSEKSSRPTLPALIKATKAFEQEQSEAMIQAAEEPIGPELYDRSSERDAPQAYS